MARPSDRAVIRRQEILENFYTVLAEEGLEGASISKIAARMGINPSLIMHYFSTKEEMIVELVDFMLDMYEEAFLPALKEIEDPEKKLEATIDAIFGLDWARLVDNSVFYAFYSLSFRNGRVKESFQRMYSRLREVLVDEIGDLMEKGIIVKADPGKLADLIISLLEGYDFYRGVMEEEERFDELSQFLKENALAILRANR
jgi:AcrR family transcriptional regulator